MTLSNIPPGYRLDAQGRLVPVDLIKPADLQRDQVVGELFAEGKALNDTLATFKARIFDTVLAHQQVMAEQYGVKIGGIKGNVTLRSFDGLRAVEVSVAEHIAFDERLAAAKELVNECILDWSQGSRDEIRLLVQSAFEVDKQGKINTGRILALRRLHIADERWQRAMQIVGDSLQVVGSKSYVRIYERDTATAAWRHLPLNIAAV